MPNLVHPDSRQATLAVLLIVGAIGGGLILAYGSARLESSHIAAAMAAALVLIIAFINSSAALYLLTFAMLFSPELGGAGTGTQTGEGASITLRLDDLLLAATACGWLLRSKFFGSQYAIRHTSISPAIWIYMAISACATLLAVIHGNVRLVAGIFHNLKYFEYFLVFYMVLAHVRSRGHLRHLLTALLIVFALAVAYGFTQLGSGQRVTAPFDAEPNTFGGYLVMLGCITGGLALCMQQSRLRLVLTLLVVASLPPLLLTLSRASYLAALVGAAAFLVVSRQRLLLAVAGVAMVCALVLGTPLLPERVRDRVLYTFEPGRQTVAVAGVQLDSSSSARLLDYKHALRKWMQRPVFGYGVTGLFFIDGQYIRVLAETGFLGLGAFLLIFLLLLLRTWRIYRQNRDDPLYAGLSMGFFCATLALLAHALSANTFVIIRIAEPFWLLAGLVLVIPHCRDSSRPASDRAAGTVDQSDQSDQSDRSDQSNPSPAGAGARARPLPTGQ